LVKFKRLLAAFLFEEVQLLVSFIPELVDRLDQISVRLHIFLVVGSVALGLNRDLLVEVSSHTLEILKLSLVFLLNLLVHLLSLALEVLNVGQKAVVDGLLELLVVVDVLDHPVDCILKCADHNLIGLNLDPRFLDHRLHLLLSLAQVVDQVPQSSVGLVEFSEFLVHLVCLSLQIHNLLLPWGDVLLELLDLVVKHILELLQFLGLLLQLVDLLLAFADLLVSLGEV